MVKMNCKLFDCKLCTQFTVKQFTVLKITVQKKSLADVQGFLILRLIEGSNLGPTD